MPKYLGRKTFCSNFANGKLGRSNPNCNKKTLNNVLYQENYGGCRQPLPAPLA